MIKIEVTEQPIKLSVGNLMYQAIGVSSVNAKTGAVVLTAVDVGADALGSAAAVREELLPRIDGIEVQIPDLATKQYVEAGLATKAEQASLDSTNATVAAQGDTLLTKADTAYVDAGLAGKSSSADLDSVRTLAESNQLNISTKAEQADLDATNNLVNTKASQVSLDATNETVNQKANTVDVYSKTDLSMTKRIQDANEVQLGAGANGWTDLLVSTQYNRTLRDKLTDFSVSIKDFGAKGNDDQTLYATDYYSDQNKGIRITQQTADGIAINSAIEYLRSVGGGSLYIPTGVHRVYGYLEPIDFPCVIYGNGDVSLIKNCDNSPTNTDGYGIFCLQPENYEEISFLNFKVDGNAEVRTKPTSEFRAYPLALYGKPQLKMWGVTSVNSPIDCFMTSYTDNDPNTYVKTVNCHFDNSYRDTVSLVSGWNQYHVNMTVDRGGYVYGGTQPRYAIDIEPNLVGRSIENLHFTNCHFKRAINVCVGGVWAQAKFDNCTFDGSIAHSTKALDKTYPWLFQFTEGKWQLNNCRFIGRDDYMQNATHHFNAYNANSKFNDSQYLKLHHCSWEKCGFISTSRSVELLGCSAQNSLHPFIVSGGTTTNNNDEFIRNLTLKNVFDGENYGTGTEASFAIAPSVGGKIDVDGVTVEVDALSIKAIPKGLFTMPRYYGVYINPAKSVAAGKRVILKNIHSEGFYKRIPLYLERAVNPTDNRDWFAPNLPPENTIKLTSAVTANLTDGTVANNQITNKSVTGTATENTAATARTLGDKGAVYQNCTMWGNYD